MSENETASVTMERDGETAEVSNDASVQIMEAQGWVLVDAEKPTTKRRKASTETNPEN